MHLITFILMYQQESSQQTKDCFIISTVSYQYHSKTILSLCLYFVFSALRRHIKYSTRISKLLKPSFLRMGFRVSLLTRRLISFYTNSIIPTVTLFPQLTKRQSL